MYQLQIAQEVQIWDAYALLFLLFNINLSNKVFWNLLFKYNSLNVNMDSNCKL